MLALLKARFFGGRITIKRIAILGLFLALLTTLKYALGFIPGIEVVTFMFVTLALILPILDLVLLIVCFNLLVIAMYGFGAWWFAYWVIWPMDVLITIVLSKFTRNRFIFGAWGFIAGFSVLIYYFFSDWAFFGIGFAYLNIFSAVPINLIEGFVTLFFVILLTPKILDVAALYAPQFWPDKISFTFKPVRWKILGYIATIFTALLAIGGTVVLFVFNSFFLDLRLTKARESNIQGTISSREKAPSNWELMTTDDYNATYLSLKDNETAIVVIANGEVTKEVVSVYQDMILYDAMQQLKTLEFKYFKTPGLGYFVNSFRKKGEAQWRHGKSNETNYGDFYPMYAVNNAYAPLGVSSFKLVPHDVVEFTYDFTLL